MVASMSCGVAPVSWTVRGSGFDSTRPVATLRRIVDEAGADSDLLDDLADVRGSLLDESCDFSSFASAPVIRV
jgi:hypothetical protein